jgi:putative transposase
MVSPSQRRRAADMIQQRLGLSQRRACQIVRQHRSTQRHRPTQPDPDKDLRSQLRAFAKAHPRWGYRRAHAILCREGHHVNRKKVQRLWREEGLRVPPRRHKRWRLGISTTPADRLTASYPDHVWALDYQFDVTATGRTIKILHITDEFTRQSLGDLVDYSIDADATVAALDKLVGQRGTHPTLIRCDNGPELTAYAVRDWCRFTGAGTSYIDPGSPWQNPWVESYGSRMRDELLSIEQFDSLLEAQVLVGDWKEEYNSYRPHSALGMLTPNEFARRWRNEHQLQLT